MGIWGSVKVFMLYVIEVYRVFVLVVVFEDVFYFVCIVWYFFSIVEYIL